jgi:hypothetical protein
VLAKFLVSATLATNQLNGNLKEGRRKKNKKTKKRPLKRFETRHKEMLIRESKR